MRNLKRALSLALASVMLVGMMVVGTSAASFSDVDSNDNTEAIEVLKALGVMNGYDDGGFHPDANVTRNQMAMIICALLGLDGEDFKDYRPFNDVPEWAVGAVGACEANGIVGGRGEGIYDGDAYVTGVEAAAMMLRALGYTEMAASANWETPIVQKANEIRLFKDVSAGSSTHLNRNAVAQLTLNTLKADVVNTVTSGTVTTPDGTVVNLGEIKYNLIPAVGTENYNSADPNTHDSDYRQLCEKLYGNDLQLDTNDEDAMGRPASTWTYKGVGDIITVANEADYTVVLKETPDDLGDLCDLAKKNLDTSSFTIATDLYRNGAVGESDTSNLGAGDVVEFYMDETNTKEVKSIFVTRYELNKIDAIDTDVSDADADEGVTCYVDFDGNGSTGVNNTDIPGFNASTYVEDAYVALLVADNGDIVDSYIVDSVEDSVDTVKGTTEITIGNTKYIAAASIGDGAGDTAVDEVKPGSDNVYTLYLDNNGYILGIVKVEGEAAGIDDVYYLDTVWSQQSGMSTTYHAQLVNLDGTERQVQLEVKDHVITATPADDENDLSQTASAKPYNGGYDSLRGLLVTISDKKVGDTSKANNNKYNLKVWDGGDDWGVQDTKITADLEKGTRSITVDDTNYRLNADTVYLFVESEADDLAVYRYVGGVAFEGTDITSSYIITEKDKTVAKYIVIATTDASQGAEFSEDVIFIKDASETKGNGFRSQTVYLPNGREETWKIAEDEYTGDAIADAVPAFYTYSENDDGYYELGDPNDMDVADDLDWQDKKSEGVLAGVTFVELFEDMLTVNNGSHDITDIDVAGASFKDLHKKDADGQYNKAVTSLSALAKAIEDGKAGEATLYLNVSKDGAVTIFVTSIGEAVEATCDHATLVGQKSENYTAAVAATCVAKGNPEYWTCPVCNKYFTNATTSTDDAPETEVDPNNHHLAVLNSDPTKHACDRQNCPGSTEASHTFTVEDTNHVCSGCGDSHAANAAANDAHGCDGAGGAAHS